MEEKEMTRKAIETLIETSQQYPEKAEEQLGELELLFHKEGEGAGRGAGYELRRQFAGGRDGFGFFLYELLKKSGMHFDKEEWKYQRIEKAPYLSPLDLLRIGENYQPPPIKFKPKEIKSKKLSLHAKFEDNPLKIVYDSTFNKTKPKPVCTKNRDTHALASYQDAADPLTHHLYITIEKKRSKRADVSPTVLEAMIMECEKDGKETLLVEGVHGVVQDKLREETFAYLYSCLIQYACKEKKSLLFNLSFNPGSQEMPMHFVNYVGWRNKKEVFYGMENPRKKEQKLEEYKCQVTAITLKDLSRKVRKMRRNLEEKLRTVFADSREALDDFAAERRYNDAWWGSSGKEEWNMRKGEAYCLQLTLQEVKKEYLKPKKELGRKIVIKGIPVPLAFLLLYLVPKMASQYWEKYGEHVKELPGLLSWDFADKRLPEIVTDYDPEKFLEELADAASSPSSDARSFDLSNLERHPTVIFNKYLQATDMGEEKFGVLDYLESKRRLYEWYGRDVPKQRFIQYSSGFGSKKEERWKEVVDVFWYDAGDKAGVVMKLTEGFNAYVVAREGAKRYVDLLYTQMKREREEGRYILYPGKKIEILRPDPKRYFDEFVFCDVGKCKEEKVKLAEMNNVLGRLFEESTGNGGIVPVQVHGGNLLCKGKEIYPMESLSPLVRIQYFSDSLVLPAGEATLALPGAECIIPFEEIHQAKQVADVLFTLKEKYTETGDKGGFLNAFR